MARGFSSVWSCALADGADTIVAPATAAGRGALAIVRWSGPGALAVAGRVCPGVDVRAARQAQLADIRGVGGALIDRAIVVVYHGPASFTGEDLVEVIGHGAPVVVAELVEAATAAGCRPARPGEFSRRAVANGKLDLLQAEGLADLVAAETAAQARSARRQQAGALSQRVTAIREALVALLATLEGSLDFGEHEVAVAGGEMARELERCRGLVAELLATADAGRRLREGGTVVISGPPNAGKSTLFNALLGEPRAIVNERAGTTRDVIEARLDLGGVPVRLVDTAGLQEDPDPIGAEGVRRALEASAEADVRVVLWPSDDWPPPEGWEEGGAATVRVRSKADLDEQTAGGAVVAVSGVTGEGLPALRRAVLEALGVAGAEVADGVAVSRRHRQCLEAAAAALAELPAGLPEVMAAGVRAALAALSELVGEVDDEAVLDAVFARFCIGK